MSTEFFLSSVNSRQRALCNNGRTRVRSPFGGLAAAAIGFIALWKVWPKVQTSDLFSWAQIVDTVGYRNTNVHSVKYLLKTSNYKTSKRFHTKSEEFTFKMISSNWIIFATLLGKSCFHISIYVLRFVFYWSSKVFFIFEKWFVKKLAFKELILIYHSSRSLIDNSMISLLH